MTLSAFRALRLAGLMAAAGAAPLIHAAAEFGPAGVAIPALPASGIAPTSFASTEPVPAASPLPEVLALVLSRDPQVRSAREALNVALAGLAQVRSRLFPSIGLSSSYGQSRETSLGEPLTRHNSRTEGFLRWNLFNGLADQTLIDAGDHERLAAVADLQRALDEACERTVEAYFDWLRLLRQSERAERRVIEIGKLNDRVQKQWAGGKATEGDAQLAASALIDARFTRDMLAADRESARVKIETLAGTRLGAPQDWALPNAASIESRFELPLDDVLAQARAGNGQWRAAEERAVAARTRVGIVAPDYLPKLDLDLRKRLSDRTNPQVDPVQRNSWTVQLTYEIPLGGEIGAKRDELAARAYGALADAERVGQSVRADLATARYRAQQARTAQEPVERQVRYLDDVVRTGEIQFEAGRRSLLQLIQLRDQRFIAEQRSADNAYRMLTAQSQWLALGGTLATTLGVTVPEDPRRRIETAP